MYKALPSITESAEELQQRVREEQDAPKRQRLPALYLLAPSQAPSRQEVAKLLAVHRHTVRAWLAAYERGGLRARLTIERAPGKRSALSPAVRAKRQKRLHERRGFGGDSEIQQYLGIVRDQLQAKPKSPRRSHPKKPLRPLRTFNTRWPRSS